MALAGNSSKRWKTLNKTNRHVGDGGLVEPSHVSDVVGTPYYLVLNNFIQLSKGHMGDPLLLRPSHPKGTPYILGHYSPMYPLVYYEVHKWVHGYN